MNNDSERARDLLRTLVANGFKRDRSDTKTICYTGSLAVAGRQVSIAVSFPDLEFTRLPEVTLLHPEQEAAQVVAHLTASGSMCFARNEDLVLDRYDVGGTALMCLELARRALERVLTHKHLEHEIEQEFPQHWLGGDSFLYDLRSKAHKQAKLYTVPREGSQSCLILCDDKRIVRRLMPDPKGLRNIAASFQPAFVFRSESTITFTKHHKQPQTLADFLIWLESVLPGTRNRAIKQMASMFPGQLSALFVNAPNGCVGIKADGAAFMVKAAQRRIGLERLLHLNAEKLKIQRLAGSRFDLDFVFRRNMIQKASLTSRRIALIGCGTIGSHLAKFLIQSGAGHDGGTLLLLDSQSLGAGNIGRHYLGISYVGENKVHGLQVELLRHFPDANIVPMHSDAVAFLGNLNGYDLVIDTTGEEALSMSINQHFIDRRAFGEAPDVLHVRLFGNGIAAQALLVDGSEYACFKCLKPDHHGDWRFSPLKSGVVAVPVAAACGESQYIAYGVAAPAIAAALTLQMTLDWNSGKLAPRMRTIRIEKKATREVIDKNPERSERCMACGNRKN